MVEAIRQRGPGAEEIKFLDLEMQTLDLRGHALALSFRARGNEFLTNRLLIDFRLL